MVNPLILNLQHRDVIAPLEQAALESIVSKVEYYRAGQDIVAEGTHPRESCLMIEGFSARSHVIEQGQRQLTAVHIPGDFVDLHSLLLKVMDHGVVALTNCTVSKVPHENLRKISAEYPHLTRMLWLSTVVDAAIHRAWIVSMGRRSSVGQVAHLLCELYLRLKAVDLTRAYSFELPITQAQLGDMMGRSVVHVNRILQFLRRKGLIAWRGASLTILDWERLQAIAGFDPTYLSLRVEPR
ncbi:MAG TPA: Crp/Fnr family transcriptional regulator [Rhizobiaceae bacterium]|nr:Crp/Fnr family transcriptional regulator [Rhizobiaceae bacterium]